MATVDALSLIDGAEPMEERGGDDDLRLLYGKLEEPPELELKRDFGVPWNDMRADGPPMTDKRLSRLDELARSILLRAVRCRTFLEVEGKKSGKWDVMSSLGGR